MRIPAEEPTRWIRRAWNVLAGQRRDAVIQPPKPPIPPQTPYWSAPQARS